MSDMSNYSKEHWDEDIRRFAEEWGEVLCKGILKMIDGVHDDDVENFKEEYGEVFDKIKRLVTGDLEDEEIRLFIDELGRGFYDDIVNLVKKRAASRERLPGTPYKKGDFIGQNYEVYDVLGMGGFGIVYLVYSHEIGSVYALKTFRDEYLEDAQTRDRFKKEAQVWIDMEYHPYLVRAHFVDKISDRLFIGIEYIAPDEEGLNSLDNYLRRRPPDLAQSLRWGIQFCHGMEYAYSRGIRAHRDIKPANIMIGQDKVLKITDFGLAGVIGNARISGIKLDIQNNKVGFSCQTMEGSGFGTPTHMPPEQFTNAAACDERSDIYSFGIVMYQMANGGSFPFLAKLPKNEEEHRRFWQDMYRLHCQAPVPKLNSPLFPIIQKCLEKDPNRRYRSFKDLRADLEPLLKRLTGELIKLPESREFEEWEWSNKGISLQCLGKYQEAIVCYNKALGINPRYAVAWNNKGNSLKDIGKYQEAIVCYNKALGINPRHAGAWNGKGAVLRLLSKPQDAIACFDKAIEINPMFAAAWNNKGNSLDYLGKYQEAIVCRDKALGINPRNDGAWNNKGNSLQYLGKYQEAMVCYDKAIGINPRNDGAWFLKGFALQTLDKYQEAMVCYDKALEINPRHADAWNNKGISLKNLGKYQEALACYDKVLEINPRDASAWNNKGISLKNLGKYQEAMACHDKALEINPKNEAAWNGKGAVLGLLSKPQDAIACFDKAIEINPKSASAWDNKGLTLHFLGKHQDAIACHDKALEINPRHAVGWRNMGSSLESLGKYQVAIEAYQNFIKFAPVHYADQITKVRGIIENLKAKVRDMGSNRATNLLKHEQATSGDDAQREANQGDAIAWYSKGTSYHNLGKYQEAIVCFDKALEINPRNTEAWYNKGNSLRNLGKHQESVDCYDKALEINPRDADSWRNKGGVLSELGKHQEAIDCFGKAIEINPHSDQVVKINGIIEGLKAKVRNMGSNKEDWALVDEFGNSKVYVDRISVQRNGSLLMAKVIYVSNPPDKDRNGKPIKETITLKGYDTNAGRHMIHQIVLNYTDGTSLHLLAEPMWLEATDGSLKILHFLRSLGTKNTESPKTKWWQFWKG